VYVPLERELRERLAEVARRERRRPQDHAAWLLEEALRREASPTMPIAAPRQESDDGSTD
jgi:hypothetical protein